MIYICGCMQSSRGFESHSLHFSFQFSRGGGHFDHRPLFHQMLKLRGSSLENFVLQKKVKLL